MPHKGRNSLITTVGTLVQSVNVAPDCQIESHSFNADSELVEKLRLDVRIVEVDGNSVTDSGELCEYLLSRDENAEVEVIYENVYEQSEPMEIANSVNFNGMPSPIAPQQPPNIVIGDLMCEEPLPLRRYRSPRGVFITQGSPNLSSVFAVGSPEQGTTESCDDDDDGDGDDYLSVNLSGEHITGFVGGELHVTSSELQPLPSESSPPLLEFESLGPPVQANDSFRLNGMRSLESSSDNFLRRRFMLAVDSVALGACIICVCQDVNPIAEIELTAMVMQASLISVNLGVKLRHRPKPEEFAEKFKGAMREGAWFVVLNAHKSIATSRVLEELLKDAGSRNFEGFSTASRIIICLEPHPHFPRSLIKGAKVMRIQCAISSGSASESPLSLATSTSRNRLVTAESWCSQRSVSHGIGGCSSFMGGETPFSKCKKRKVRISASVEVVDIAPRGILAPPRERSFHVSGSVALRTAFAGVPGDRFFCVASAGEEGRFAVGSSMGNVYFVDELGNSLMQAQAHETSIWDLSFSDKYHFATGCEDGTCIEWVFETGSTEEAVLVPFASISLGGDAYCVTYVRGTAPSPLLIGGLSNTVLLRGTDGVTKNIQIASSAQVIDTFPSGSTALLGESDGCVTAIDIMTATPVVRFREHTRKLPALTVRNDNHFFTGSFDGKILSWDYRIPQGSTGEVEVGSVPTSSPVHTLKLKNYVTGVHVDDVHLAATVGENLYLWDVRKLGEVLGGFPQAWRGLTRGLKVSSTAQCVVTASQDGHVRFWSFV